MRLVIRSRGVELTDSLRDQVTRRIHFALSRLAPALTRAEVTVADLNGPRGGVDKACRVRLIGPGLAEVVIEERDADIAAAVDLAAGRAARTVVRALDRRRVAFPRPLVTS